MTNKHIIARSLVLAGMAMLLALIFATDFITGYSVGFGGYYLLLVMATAWYSGATEAYLLAILSVVCRFFVITYAPVYGFFPEYLYFFKLIDLTSKCIIVFVGCYLTLKIKEHIKVLHKMSKTDSLTGAMISKVFRENVASEIVRAKRYGHPLTLVYFDIDQFKKINDVYGHGVGDKVLQEVANGVNSNLREHDALGRMGGDEFAILLVETGIEEAKAITDRIRQNLIDAMLKFNTAITFSFGAVTYLGETKMDVDALEKEADSVMYSIKNGTKNNIGYSALK
jgi:diguanylate cyclase (GGDEF)-like protein